MNQNFQAMMVGGWRRGTFQKKEQKNMRQAPELGEMLICSENPDIVNAVRHYLYSPFRMEQKSRPTVSIWDNTERPFKL